MLDIRERANEVTQEEDRLFVKIDCKRVARIDEEGKRHALEATERGYEMLDGEVYEIDFGQEQKYYFAGEEIDKDKVGVYLDLLRVRN